MNTIEFTFRILREDKDDNGCNWLSRFVENHSPIWSVAEKACQMPEDRAKKVAQYLCDTYGYKLLCFSERESPLNQRKSFMKQWGKKEGHQRFTEYTKQFKFKKNDKEGT